MKPKIPTMGLIRDEIERTTNVFIPHLDIHSYSSMRLTCKGARHANLFSSAANKKTFAPIKVYEFVPILRR